MTVTTGPAMMELRQYTLHPGARDTLIDLFEREFVETQEAVGIEVIGQFRDLDDPDRFVWLRGFQDLPSRAPALAAFYGGPVWATHREAANETMIDSDDVLLLRPATATSGFVVDRRRRSRPEAPPGPDRGLVVATVCHVEPDAEAELGRLFAQTLAPELSRAGASVLAVLVTEVAENAFPALPVREDEHVLVWFSAFSGPNAYEEHARALERSTRWRDTLWPGLASHLRTQPEVLRLAPTSRSLVPG